MATRVESGGMKARHEETRVQQEATRVVDVGDP